MIAATIKVVGIIALFPYLINFMLRARDRFISTVADVKTLPDGTLKNNEITALRSLFIFRSPAKEKTLVIRCLLVQAVFGFVPVLFAYYHVNLISLGP